MFVLITADLNLLLKQGWLVLLRLHEIFAKRKPALLTAPSNYHLWLSKLPLFCSRLDKLLSGRQSTMDNKFIYISLSFCIKATKGRLLHTTIWENIFIQNCRIPASQDCSTLFLTRKISIKYFVSSSYRNLCVCCKRVTMNKKTGGRKLAIKRLSLELSFPRNFMHIIIGWLQNRSISSGLEPVLSHAEKSYIISHYRQFSTYTKITKVVLIL